jgi:DNA-binding CsgD family transcriptional regulator
MPGADHNRAALSPRELEIVRMVAQGHQNKIIAGILNISTWTVCAHVRRIFAKLGVSSRAAMVARLLEDNGLLKSSSAGTDRSGPRASPGRDLIGKLSNLNNQRGQTPERNTDDAAMTKRRTIEIDGTEARAARRGNAAALSDKRPVAV